MKTLSKLLQLIDTISIFTGKAFSFLVIPIMLLQAIEVFLRYVLNRPTIWIWELCVYLFGLMFVIGGAWVLQEDRHVRTDVFAQKFTKRQSAIIESILYPVLGFVFLIPLTDGQIQAAIKSIIGKETSFNAWGPPLYHFKTLIAFGFVTMLMQAFANWIRKVFYAIKAVEI